MNTEYASILLGLALLVIGLIVTTSHMSAIAHRVEVIGESVMDNRKVISQTALEVYKIRSRQLSDGEKIAFVKYFCEEYSWRLVHFSEDELMEMAREESRRQEIIEQEHTANAWYGSDR